MSEEDIIIIAKGAGLELSAPGTGASEFCIFEEEDVN